MSNIEAVTAMLADENGLAVISTTQADGRILSSVTNCGVIKHPANGEAQIAFVSIGSAARFGHICRGAPVTVTIRGWTWLSVTGRAELIGPEQQPDGCDDDALRRLLREVFHAAGGTHDDLNEYDQAMAEEGRVAVLAAPERILGDSRRPLARTRRRSTTPTVPIAQRAQPTRRHTHAVGPSRRRTFASAWPGRVLRLTAAQRAASRGQRR